jgi:predicted glycosyltransferase
MRVWIDLTNSPHVLVLRPVIELLRAEGHEVSVTARDFAQTLQLLDRLKIEHKAIGHHRGGRLGAKAVGLAARSTALARWARRHPPFDLALGHGSNDISVAARLLKVPCTTTFDYEWAKVQHQVNCRLCQAVVVPEAIPPERLYRYGARGKIRAYEGLKEEYYLSDFEPDERVLDELALDRRRPIVVVRTPPAVSLYHRFENDLFAQVLTRLHGAASGEGGVQPVVLPRTQEQRAKLRGLDGFTIPQDAIDAQSLIAYADLVVSAGGTMNREAVALGTPVYTTFEGRLGAVDERLIAEGRLRRLQSVDELDRALRASASESERERGAERSEGAERRGERDRASGPARPHERGAERSEGAEPGTPPAPGADPPGRQPRIRRDPRLLTELLLSPLERPNALNSR